MYVYTHTALTNALPFSSVGCYRDTRYHLCLKFRQCYLCVRLFPRGYNFPKKKILELQQTIQCLSLEASLQIKQAFILFFFFLNLHMVRNK